jgi:plasmid maintenance system antidote protein VapI
MSRYGYTQSKLAQLMAVSQATVSNMVRGCEISAENARKLHALMGIPLYVMRPDLWTKPGKKQ